MGRQLSKTFILVIILSLLPGLAIPAGPPESVRFTSQDGVKLKGYLFGRGDKGVVLAHMYPTDQKSWRPFAEELADKGYRALTFDFRGYGESAGQKEISLIDRDLLAAVLFLKGRGLKKVYLIGASMGGMAAIKVAAREPVAGVVTLGSPLSFQGLDAGADVAKVKAPKLFIASERDPYNGQSAKTFYQRASGIKETLVFPSEAHGTFLFDTPHAAALKSALLKFIEKN